VVYHPIAFIHTKCNDEFNASPRQPPSIPSVWRGAQLIGGQAVAASKYVCHPFVDLGSISFRCPVIGRHPTEGMACTEYCRLEQEYQAAVRHWTEFRAPLTVLLPGRPSVNPLKQEALLARNRAADLLYLHRRWCPACKKGEVGLIDLSDVAL
jgi:hypothetical protein